MELQYRLQPGELLEVGEHLRVSLRSEELAAIGRVWILHDPAQSAAQRLILSLEVPLATGERQKKP